MADESTTQAPEITAEKFLELVDKFSADDTVASELSRKFNPLAKIGDDMSEIGKLINSDRRLASFVDKTKNQYYNDQIEKNKDKLYHDWHLEKNPTDDPALREAKLARQEANRMGLEAYAFRKANRFGLQETDIESWVLPIAKSQEDVDNLAKQLKERFSFNEQEVRRDERERIAKASGQNLKESNPESSTTPSFTVSQIKKMTQKEFSDNYNAIKAAEKAGKIIQQ